MAIKVLIAEQFTAIVNRLQKKYPHVVDDVLTLIGQLEKGEILGDRLQELAPYIVYKVRVKNSDARKGKRGGYRVIYYIKTVDQVMLATLYYKLDRADISAKELKRIIDEIEGKS